MVRHWLGYIDGKQLPAAPAPVIPEHRELIEQDLEVKDLRAILGGLTQHALLSNHLLSALFPRRHPDILHLRGLCAKIHGLRPASSCDPSNRVENLRIQQCNEIHRFDDGDVPERAEIEQMSIPADDVIHLSRNSRFEKFVVGWSATITTIFSSGVTNSAFCKRYSVAVTISI